MRTTLLGSLLDVAAAQPLARHATTCGCSRSAPSTSTARRAAAARPTGNPLVPASRIPALPAERTHVGALLTGRAARRRAGASPSRRARTSSPPRACSRR